MTTDGRPPTNDHRRTTTDERMVPFGSLFPSRLTPYGAHLEKASFVPNFS